MGGPKWDTFLNYNRDINFSVKMSCGREKINCTSLRATFPTS